LTFLPLHSGAASGGIALPDCSRSDRYRFVNTGRPLDAAAVAAMLILCASWGLNQVAIKFALVDFPPLIQGALRSAGALPVVFVAAHLRGVRLGARDGTLMAGLTAGTLFGFEFIFIYYALTLTTASRGVVFVYTAPVFVGLGARLFLGEWFSVAQWSGLALSFLGMLVAIGVPDPTVGASTLLGDALMIVGAALWAATTLFLKASSLAHVPTEKTSLYQYAVSGIIFAAGAPLAGEAMTHWPRPVAVSWLAYQSIWVLGVTFTIWFGLVVSYSASRLSAFSYLTPLFGVAAGHYILGDPLTPTFAVAVALVIAGLVLVNRPR
jgi:drug/metabolite transporter (DMT)-like permease